VQLTAAALLAQAAWAACTKPVKGQINSSSAVPSRWLNERNDRRRGEYTAASFFVRIFAPLLSFL
jgi:hypothetical protein